MAAVMLVTGTLAVGSSLGLEAWQDAQEVSMRERVAGLEAREMAQIHRATTAYLAQNPDAVDAGQSAEITFEALENDGLIPQGLAERDGCRERCSPMREAYQIHAYHDPADGVTRAVVAAVVDGDNVRSAARMARMGMDVDGQNARAASARAWAKDIAERVSGDYRHSAGFVREGSFRAQGLQDSWDVNVRRYLQRRPDEAQTVSLVNWPELDTDNGAITGGGQTGVLTVDDILADIGGSGATAETSPRFSDSDACPNVFGSPNGRWEPAGDGSFQFQLSADGRLLVDRGEIGADSCDIADTGACTVSLLFEAFPCGARDTGSAQLRLTGHVLNTQLSKPGDPLGSDDDFTAKVTLPWKGR